MAHESPPAILQIFVEPLTPGSEAVYRMIEDETARLCVDLKCPHPHVAIEPLTGPKEVWWLNAFESEADKQRVENAYAQNRALMAALERNSKRKAAVTGRPIDIVARFRADLSHGATWTLRGTRFLVIAFTRRDVTLNACVFESADGARYILKPVATREQAGAEARAVGRGARVFAVRPNWGLPAKEWVEADPDFWNSNPLVSRRQM